MAQAQLKFDAAPKRTRRPGAGRPRKPPSEKIEHQINTRFDGPLYDAICRVAFDRGLTVAQTVRMVLQEALA